MNVKCRTAKHKAADPNHMMNPIVHCVLVNSVVALPVKKLDRIQPNDNAVINPMIQKVITNVYPFLVFLDFALINNA